MIYYIILLLFPLCLIVLRFSRFLLHLLPGEITGMIPILVFSLFITLFVSFPLGILFVFNTHFREGNLYQVYLLESIGSSVAGVVVYLFFIPLFSNWHGAAILAALASLIVFFSFGERRQKFLFFLVLILLTLFGLFDFPSQKIFWKPYRIIESKDTIYGKLQVLQTHEQISLYNNTLLVYSYPNLSAAEESIHFALLQNPYAEDVLLIGGGAGGSLREILKYPRARVDYVEIDPEIIRLSMKFLPEEERAAFRNERVHIFFQDGRAFLNRIQKKYDIVILNLPEPATAQINRFYTREFFRDVRKKLKDNGLISFRVPSAENYISHELQHFLSSLYFSLKEVFPEVKVVPGDTNIFLASHHTLTIEFEKLNQKIDELHLQNKYVRPELLFARLNLLRVSMLEEVIRRGKKTINLDFVPISYFYNSVLWSSLFQGAEKKIFSFLSRVRSFWLLDIPLMLFVLCLVLLWILRRKTSFFLTPLAVMGFTTIVFEIIVIISFQTMYGYLYKRIALLLASFMFGLSLGALRGINRKRIDYSRLILIQFGFMLILLGFFLVLRIRPPEFLFFLFLLLIGFLGGDLFIISNNLYLKEKINYGLGYGLDLLGSFLGALISSSLLIPLVGLPLLLQYLFLLNSFCLLFLVSGLFRS